jgi:hypothetical protein
MQHSGSMNRLSTDRRAAILGMLVEGNSLRATTRMAGCSINTVSKLLLDIGEACASYQDEHLRDLSWLSVLLRSIQTETPPASDPASAAPRPRCR